MPDMTGDMMGGMMGMMALMLLIPSLTILLAAALIAWALRGRGAASGDADPPLTILQRRYARGDIGTDEYERMRAALVKD